MTPPAATRGPEAVVQAGIGDSNQFFFHLLMADFSAEFACICR